MDISFTNRSVLLLLSLICLAVIVSANRATLPTDSRAVTDVDDADTQVSFNTINRLNLKKFKTLLSGRWEKGFEVLQKDERSTVGFTAQDVLQVLPEAGKSYK